MDWTYEDALAEMHERRYGKEIRIMYEDSVAQKMRERIVEQAKVFPEDVKAGAVLGHKIEQDIRRGGLDGDLPPSVIKMYSDYNRKAEAEQADAHRARHMQEEAMRSERRLEDEHIQWLQRMGFSVQNYLNSKV